MDTWAQFAMFTSGCAVSLGIALAFMPPSTGTATPMKIYGLLTVLSAFAWLIFSVVVGRNFQYLFIQYLPSTAIIKSAMRSYERGQTKSGMAKLALGLFAGIAVNEVLINILESMLQNSPLIWCLYAGINPLIPIGYFGIAPLLHALASVQVFLSYANVLKIGGDGSEFVEPERIEWFYSLSRKEQGKIRDARGDLSDSSSDSDDDESEDEKPVAPVKARVAAAGAAHTASKSAAKVDGSIVYTGKDEQDDSILVPESDVKPDKKEQKAGKTETPAKTEKPEKNNKGSNIFEDEEDIF